MNDRSEDAIYAEFEARAQDFMCCVEELATLHAIKTRRQLDGHENARRLALKGLAVQILLTIAYKGEVPRFPSLDSRPLDGQG